MSYERLRGKRGSSSHNDDCNFTGNFNQQLNMKETLPQNKHTPTEASKDFSSKFSSRFGRIAELADAGRDKLYGTELAHLESDIMHYLQSQADQCEREKGEMVREMLEKIETSEVTEDELAHSGGEILDLKKQYNAAKKGDQEHIKTIAQKYGVDLSE